MNQLPVDQLVVSDKQSVTLRGKPGTAFKLARVQRNELGETVAVHIGAFFAPKVKASDSDCLAAAENRV